MSQHPIPQEITENQRAKWAQRLRMPNPDRSDVGQELPLTGQALNTKVQSGKEAASKVVALVRALGQERLVVAVPVEAHPESPDHAPVDLGGATPPPLNLVEGPVEGPRGANVAAFSSAAELASYDPSARPMTMSAQQVAVIAGLSQGSGGIVVNPGSERETIIPRSAALALAAADQWLPPWEDRNLTEELLRNARAVCGDVVGVKIEPVAGDSQTWDGAIRVEVQVDMAPHSGHGGSTSDPVGPRRLLAAALQTVTSNERLKESSSHIEVVPIPVYGV